MKRFVLGIAGFIGSGKTTVARMFEGFGAFRTDADEVVDQLYQPGQAGFEKIRDFFGDEYFRKSASPAKQGTILNRRKLARVVFQDPKKLKILHGLIHPLVTSEVQKQIDKNRAPFAVLEATYFEKKFLRSLVNKILWVDTKKNIAFERLQESRSMNREMFEKIYRLQMKPSKIDFEIENNGSLDDLASKVKGLFNRIQQF